MELVKPSVEYKESFIAAVKDMQSDVMWKDKNLSEIEKDFAGYVKKLSDEEKGIGLPEGYLPHTTLWLIDNDEFIGHVDIRHTLNDKLLFYGGHIGYSVRPSKRNMGYGTKILELALPVAKRLGIDKVLVTCDDDNIGSVKIIEKNGGILENKLETEGKLKRRYWIENK